MVVIPSNRLHRVIGHSGLPISEVGRQKVHRKGRRLHRGPTLRLRPQQLGLHGDFLCGRAPLHVAHYPLAGTLDHTGKFASGDERRGRSSAIVAAGCHGVGEINSYGLDANDDLARSGLRLGNIVNFQNFRTTGASDENGFHMDFDCTTRLSRRAVMEQAS